MLRPEDFFDLSGYRYKELFEGIEYVWESLKKKKGFIKETIAPNVSKIIKKGNVLDKTCILYMDELITDGFELQMGDATKGGFRVFRKGEILEGASVLYATAVLTSDDIFIGRGTVVEPGALIKGPAIIGEYTEVRQGAYIRGDVIIGDKCVVGHTTEVKGSIMLNGSKAGHFAYIGDSILGNEVNLGAGTKLANLKIYGSTIRLKIQGKEYETGFRKFGAVIGDYTETGCNTVLNPGVLLGKSILIYPNTSVKKGYYPSESVIKLRQEVEVLIKKDKRTN